MPKTPGPNITPEETLAVLRLDLAHRADGLAAALRDPDALPEVIMVATAMRVVLRELVALIDH